MQQNINISLDQTTPVKCDECENDHFIQALHIRKVSAILSGTGQPSYLPIPMFACTKCNHVNIEFRPKEIRDLEE